MLVLIDSGNIEEIKKLYSEFSYDGVTTNPTLLKRENKNPIELLKEIRNTIPKEAQLHVQTISTSCEEIVKEGQYILDVIGKDTFIKIPVSAQGVKAMGELSGKGIKVTATAIYTPMQAFMAAKAGACFVAPYVNRLDNLGVSGIEITKDIHDILAVHNMNGKTKVLAASFKNTLQVLKLCQYGIGAITASREVLEQLVLHTVTSVAINDFNRDFEALCGEGKTMLNCNE